MRGPGFLPGASTLPLLTTNMSSGWTASCLNFQTWRHIIYNLVCKKKAWHLLVKKYWAIKSNTSTSHFSRWTNRSHRVAPSPGIATGLPAMRTHLSILGFKLALQVRRKRTRFKSMLLRYHHPFNHMVSPMFLCVLLWILFSVSREVGCGLRGRKVAWFGRGYRSLVGYDLGASNEPIFWKGHSKFRGNAIHMGPNCQCTGCSLVWSYHNSITTMIFKQFDSWGPMGGWPLCGMECPLWFVSSERQSWDVNSSQSWGCIDGPNAAREINKKARAP